MKPEPIRWLLGLPGRPEPEAIWVVMEACSLGFGRHCWHYGPPFGPTRCHIRKVNADVFRVMLVDGQPMCDHMTLRSAQACVEQAVRAGNPGFLPGASSCP